VTAGFLASQASATLAGTSMRSTAASSERLPKLSLDLTWCLAAPRSRHQRSTVSAVRSGGLDADPASSPANSPQR
jgi:hypothetical protein